ncbi:MAG: helix-hairpin-helix domain-containing protein [Candidatus Eremiobacteraeota bacterium]|nr:helix-hairpin-helix domain-containing protein [Candidatus Eremiobacteraeota bacterium]
MKRFYLIAAGLVVAGALALHPPQRQSKPALTASARPTARLTRNAVETVTVYVVGAVARSGVYRLRGGTRILDAVSSAGGLTAKADPAGVNLAELLTDGQEIVVPLRGEVSEPITQRSPSRHAARRKRRTPHRGTGRHRKAPPEHAIDINTADVAALQTLPGVGAGLAQRLIDFREVNGPFHTIDELADVAGMTDRRIEQITPYIMLQPH